MRPSCHGQAGKWTKVATHAKGAATTQPEKGARMQGGGDGYAGRELDIGPLEKIGGAALCATSPKHKVAPKNPGSKIPAE